jgi:quinol monooxygenase YgiN
MLAGLRINPLQNECTTKEETGMGEQVVHFTVDFSINEGKLAEFESTARTMTVSSQKEHGTIGYEWYFSKDRKQCRLLESYVDANAVLAHLSGPVVQEWVPKIQQYSSIGGFEVYGDPGPKATEILEGIEAKIFLHWHGLSK